MKKDLPDTTREIANQLTQKANKMDADTRSMWRGNISKEELEKRREETRREIKALGEIISNL